MKRVIYDLATQPTTFDFAVVACAAKTLGYDEIKFIVGKIADWKYAEAIAWKRFANVVLPLCALARMPYSVNSTKRVEGDVLRYGTGAIVSAFETEGKIEKLRASYGVDKTGYVTITMRKSFRNSWRNSNEPAWARVSEWLEKRGEEVVVIPESEDSPMDLDERLAIYSGAKMNLAVGNGTGVLCWLSDAPYLHFMLPEPPGSEIQREGLREQWKRVGFPVGSQLPFRTERQEIVWGPDDYRTITAAWERMFSKGGA